MSSLHERFRRTHRLDVEADSSGQFRLLITADTDLSILSFVRFQLGQVAAVARISAEELDHRLDACSAGTNGSLPSTSAPLSSGVVSDSRVAQLVDDLIRSAILSRASDIHFEPGEQELACRMRIDGMLLLKQTIERSQAPELLSRLKIMARLDIAERRRPQDGRIRFGHDDRQVDIRVSIIPTEFGEKAVLRILDKAQLRLDMDSLGLSGQQLPVFRQLISSANGIVLVTGPTGSGKTTTLYSALNYLKTPQINISTVEDPIEYHLSGINQTQVKPEIGLTFATMLRALLRQDPNIIMLGEIRDHETLEIALRASMTGHLVLSTLHTNSAVASVTRLLDMGAEPFLLSSSLRLIVAQRLVRLICQSCAGPLGKVELTAAVRLGYHPEGLERQGLGCPACNQTGFAGRQALYEILPISDTIQSLIQERGSEAKLGAYARSQGLVTLKEAGFGLIRRGMTTPSELLREVS